MFVALIGTRSSGKSTVKDYLVKLKEFTSIRLIQRDIDSISFSDSISGANDLLRPFFSNAASERNRDRPTSFLLMNSPVVPAFPSLSPRINSEGLPSREGELVFDNIQDILEHVTRNWRSDFVTTDLNTKSLLETFATRPFFMVVGVDAPMILRYQRTLRQGTARPSLEDFIREHDLYFYGPQALDVLMHKNPVSGAGDIPSLRSLDHMVNMRIVNGYQTVSDLHYHLEELDLTNPERLRPAWDTYFMQLASLGSLRSNCMKRRVGAILVRNRRILSTGYNGTPRGLKNCNEGGCLRCNNGNHASDECLCLHAEENALIEAGRERIGNDTVLYCNTCPCLKCTIKIIQTGVKEVVYNLSYKVDDASAALFKEAGIVLRRHAPPPEI